MKTDSMMAMKSPESDLSPRKFQLSRPAMLLLVLVALVVFAYFAQPLVKQLGPPEKCWEMREESGRLYKVNPCTGQFRLIGETTAAENEK